MLASKTTRPLHFDSPRGSERARRNIQVEGFGEAHLSIHESKEKLDFNQGDPSSVAGILVKTEGAVLDSRLFGFEGEEAAHYFFGSLDCPGIAATIRSGDLGVLDPSRSGLDWRHQYCKALHEDVRKVLRPLVQEKRRQLEGSAQRPVREQYKKKLADVCKLLNSMVADELEDLPDWGDPGKTIETLIMRPEVGYAEANVPRNFTVYVPERLAAQSGPDDEVELSIIAGKGKVRLLSDEVALTPHHKYEGILSGRFAAVGTSYGDEASILASLNGLSDVAQLIIKPVSTRPKGPPTGRTRGLFKEIDFDDAANPIQRVSFSDGVIKVYIRFPPISNYLNPAVRAWTRRRAA